MPSFFGGLREGLDRSRTRARQSEQDAMDALLKRVQLEEAGFSVVDEPTRGLFGTGLFGGTRQTVQRTPGFVSKSELDRQKAELDIQKTRQSIEDANLARTMIGQMTGLPVVPQNSANFLSPQNLKDQSAPQRLQPTQKNQIGRTDFSLAPETVKFGGQTFSTPTKFQNKMELERQKKQIPRALTELEQFDLGQKQEQVKFANESVKTAAQDTLNSIKKIKENIDFFGAFGGLPSIPGSARARTESEVNRLLSQKVINVMQEMKQASKTGATGFGQLSNKELELLRNASTALKRTLRPEDALEILNQLEQVTKKVLGENSQGNPLSSMSDEELRKLAGL